MIVTSKNGVKLDISPTDWWNVKDWIACIRGIWFVKRNNIHIDMKDWRHWARGNGSIA